MSRPVTLSRQPATAGRAFAPLFLLLLLVAAAVLAAVWLRRDDAAVTATLSPRQLSLVRQFGPPQAFAVTFEEVDDGQGPQAMRAETWCYQDNLTSFSFVDGEFCGSSPSQPLPPSSQATPYRPEQFRAGMTPQQVQQELALPGLTDLDLAELGLKTQLPAGLKLSFAPQLVLGFARDRLQYVEAFPASPIAGVVK